jgi:hypothetical protein
VARLACSRGVRFHRRPPFEGRSKRCRAPPTREGEPDEFGCRHPRELSRARRHRVAEQPRRWSGCAGVPASSCGSHSPSLAAPRRVDRCTGSVGPISPAGRLHGELAPVMMVGGVTVAAAGGGLMSGRVCSGPECYGALDLRGFVGLGLVMLGGTVLIAGSVRAVLETRGIRCDELLESYCGEVPDEACLASLRRTCSCGDGEACSALDPCRVESPQRGEPLPAGRGGSLLSWRPSLKENSSDLAHLSVKRTVHDRASFPARMKATDRGATSEGNGPRAVSVGHRGHATFPGTGG